MKETQNAVSYLVKKPNETEDFSFTATIDEIVAGLKTGQIDREWGVKKESDSYWVTIHELIYGPPPKSPSAPPAKRILVCASIVFVALCLIPPWQFTADRNGNYGFHSRKPAGYSLIFSPPVNPEAGVPFGVQIDFGRLFLEWAALAALTGTVWMLVGKPAWLRNGKTSRLQKPVLPDSNSKN